MRAEMRARECARAAAMPGSQRARQSVPVLLRALYRPFFLSPLSVSAAVAAAAVFAAAADPDVAGVNVV